MPPNLGTPMELTDDKGKIVWEGDYKAFGQAKATSFDGFTNNLRFLGQYWDEETGLHYNRYRYYDPNSGRYISKDPIELAGGVNQFAYTANPARLIDPLGLQSSDPSLVMADRAAGVPRGSPLGNFASQPRDDSNPLGWGCGDSKTDNFVPDKPLNFDFMKACRAHDICYGDKNGPEKRSCDEKFKEDMEAECAKFSWPKKNVCNSLAHDYYKAVNIFGGEAFSNGKK
jgi:RHS repeat-associated protein